MFRLRRRGVSPRNRSRRSGRGALASVLICNLAACGTLDDLLVVDVPGVVPATRVETPEGVDGLMAGVVGSFECALVRFIIAGGYVGNELADATFTQFRFAGLMRRDPDRSALETSTATCDAPFALYTPLSQARWLADHTIGLLENWTDAQVARRVARLATAYVYSGYSHTLIGEMYCSAAFDGGPQVTPFEVFRRAEDRFTAAIEHGTAAGEQNIVNLARVGRARVRNNLGKAADAVADAREVPADFVYVARYSDQSTATRNQFFNQNYQGNTFTIKEPFRNVRWQGVPDPRVRVTDLGRNGADGATRMWIQHKYTSPSTAIPIGRWAEAQLIIAEIEGGQTAVGIINALHAKAGLPPFQSTDAAEIRAHVIEERQWELFLEGQHLYTMIRLELPMFPAPGAPYKPPSTTFYGDQLCQPLPTVETENNPNISDEDVIWDVIRG